MNAFLNRLRAMKPGYYIVRYQGRSYGMTFEVSADKRRRKLFAEELGGKDYISFNLYSLAGKEPLLKPCEMPAQKVIDFVVGFHMENS